MKIINRIALALTIIGAINWGLIGFFKFDLVGAIFGGQGAFLSRVIFGIVGLSGLACVALLFEPMRNVDQDINRQSFGKPNYGTEFGEETDVSNLNRPSRQVYEQNQNPSDKE
ncbi:DUF378 domain-containing protein [Bacillus sp. FJAT-29790]|uniref:DUF378 domain-containing protein n=1 Tax=Bacillus sp. FJAT-29790 TaxID=1895002 RepID=UPI001C211F38|nr:DUF378 domain-containing protein [Bacillus sp. FJAT-29790]MBU8878996.1 DUF378 domain-containing protein [Bacillus sp. FJAT-29790]